MKINVSGRLYDIVPYEVSPEDHRIDMDEVERLAKEHRPKLLLAGWSAYPRVLDFPRFREIADEVGALLMVDMAHFAGLVAAGIHPSPVPYADVVTTTVHKTLGGPRSGLILCREEYAKKINSAVFPGQQGGPLEHAIAAKAVAFKIAASDLFKERQQRTVAGAQALAEELLTAGDGVNVLTGGTDVHLVLVDLRDSELDGQQAEDRLHSIGITVNRNAVPFDPRPPMVTSGLRIGTPALATRGLQADDFHEVGKIIARALQPGFEDARAGADRARDGDRRSLPAVRAPGHPRDGLGRTLSGGGRERIGRPRARRARSADAARPRRGDPRLGPAAPGDARPRGGAAGPGLATWCAIDVADERRRARPARRRCPATSRRCRPTPRTAPRSSCARASRSSSRDAEDAFAPRRCDALLRARSTCAAACTRSARCTLLLGRPALRRVRGRAGGRDRPPHRDRDRGPSAREQRYRMLFEASPMPMWVYDADDARVPGRQRRRGPPLRLLARGVPGDDGSRTSARPRTSRAAGRRRRRAAARARRRRGSGATCARTAR